MSRTLVVTALRTERAALHRHVAGATLARTGMGPDRAGRWRPGADLARLQAAVITGLAGGLAPDARPGEVVVATEVRDDAGTLALPGAVALAGRLADAGHPVRLGPIVTTSRLVGGAAERAALAAAGAIAVDMESAPLARTLGARVAVAVVRIVVDTPTTPLLRLATVPAGIAALRRLRAIGPIIGAWDGAGAG